MREIVVGQRTRQDDLAELWAPRRNTAAEYQCFRKGQTSSEPADGPFEGTVRNKRSLLSSNFFEVETVLGSLRYFRG